jgi:glycerophosphoryl diester phosphodiesterase
MTRTMSTARRRPAVVAHRGASDRAPEHTYAAYAQAIVDGADALEADVRLTADGHLVCVHDRRIDRTSNGHGVLSTLELAELQQLDFGSWKPTADAPDAPDLDADRRSVLTLERLIELVLDADHRVELAIETKHPTRYAGLVEKRVVEVLAQYGLAQPTGERAGLVRVMSFSEVAVRRMVRLAPLLPLVYLMERVPIVYRTGSLPRGVGIAGPSLEIVKAHPRYVQRVHEAGGLVHVWTVDDLDDVAYLAELGVDAIITNRPLQVLNALEG